MSKYELTFLLPEEATVSEIKDLVASFKSKVENEQSWGKKTLAYPIKKNRSAYFFHWLLSIKQSDISELKKKLNFNEKIIRYLLLKMTR